MKNKSQLPRLVFHLSSLDNVALSHKTKIAIQYLLHSHVSISLLAKVKITYCL